MGAWECKTGGGIRGASPRAVEPNNRRWYFIASLKYRLLKVKSYGGQGPCPPENFSNTYLLNIAKNALFTSKFTIYRKKAVGEEIDIQSRTCNKTFTCSFETNLRGTDFVADLSAF